VLITDVGQNSPAWRAGLQPGQIIASVDRKPVGNVSEFTQALSSAEGGRVLLLVGDGRGSRFVVVTIE